MLRGDLTPAHAKHGDSTPGVADAIGDGEVPRRGQTDREATLQAAFMPGAQVVFAHRAIRREENQQQSGMADDRVAEQLPGQS